MRDKEIKLEKVHDLDDDDNNNSCNVDEGLKYSDVCSSKNNENNYILNLFGFLIDTNFNFVNDKNNSDNCSIFNFKNLPFLFLIEDDIIKINIEESILIDNIKDGKNNFFNFLFIKGFKFTYVLKFLNIENGHIYYNIAIIKENLNINNANNTNSNDFNSNIDSFLYHNIKNNKNKTILSYSKLDTFLFNSKIINI